MVHVKHDLFTEALVLHITYIQSFMFQLHTDLEIFAFCFSSIFNNLKSLKIIKYRRNEKMKKSKDLHVGLKKHFTHGVGRWKHIHSYIYLKILGGCYIEP